MRMKAGPPMTTHSARDIPEHQPLSQRIEILQQIIKVAAQLDMPELQQVERMLALLHTLLAQQSQPYTPMPPPIVTQPLAVNSRQAAKLLGIGHPLFYKEIMPHVYSGAILSYQIGRTRIILVESLRHWIEQAAISAQPPPEG